MTTRANSATSADEVAAQFGWHPNQRVEPALPVQRRSRTAIAGRHGWSQNIRSERHQPTRLSLG